MKRSFTVTELLVAIAIIVILAGILIGGLGYAGRRADEAKTIAAIQKLSAALEAFRAENGYYPPNSTNPFLVAFYLKGDDRELMFAPRASETINPTSEFKFVDKQGKPFMELNGITATVKNKAEVFVDAWGIALRYQCPGIHNKSAFDLYSYGPDKKSSTDDEKLDDITNWDSASNQ